MKWEGYRQSENVDDMRGGGRSAGRVGGGVGIGGLILMGVLYFGFGIDPRVVMNTGLVGGGGQIQEQRAQPTDPNDRMARFVSTILATTEDAWEEIFRLQVRRAYEPPRLTLLSGATRSACGDADAAMGPFYCPADRRVYLDMVFFRELEQRFRAPGEFAAACVIGHEVGHHVQNLMGILPEVQRAQRGMSEGQANQMQVRVELQADCFAGIWANKAGRIGLIDQADVEAALRAAAAIGDDTLQRQSTGRVVPESFTHGSSEQRMRWFMAGERTGQIQACNTFNTRQV
jgi:predicted metalloprotease